MKIGFFDSGIGGLTVLHRAIEALPDEKFIFYADEDNVPYGEKSRAEILSFSDNATSFLIENGAKIIVIACNTATSAAVAHLRGKYNIPFIGMEPAVKPAIACADGKRVLVTATPFTIRDRYFSTVAPRFSITASLVSSSLLTALPTVCAILDWFFGMMPGVNGSLYLPIYTALYGWKSILIAI